MALHGSSRPPCSDLRPVRPNREPPGSRGPQQYARQPVPTLGSDDAPAPVQQTIHVTIGRIEVRATPPPSAPPRKQAAAPVMSLDEYLKTRSGGQR